MAAKNDPKFNLFYGWDLGENGWKTGMDSNMLRLGVVGVHLSVISNQIQTPPATPATGDTYIVPSAASGVWTGHAMQVAYWDGSAWQFESPKEGWRADVQDADAHVRFRGGAWGDYAGGSGGGGMTNPMTAEGDMIFGGVGGVPTRLGGGLAGQYLRVDPDGKPKWDGGGGGGGLPPMEEGDMLYAGPGGALQVIEAGSTGMVLKLAGLSPYWGFPETKTAVSIACSDETTTLTTGLKVTFRLPHDMLFTKLRASLTAASSSGAVIVGFNIGGNAAGSVSIASGLKSATVAPSIVSANDDTEVTVTISGAGTNAKGLKVYLIGTVTTT